METKQLQPSGTMQERPGVRWWPAIVILLLAAAVLVFVRRSEGVDHQTKNLQTGGIVFLTVGLLFLWVLFLSRLRWARRAWLCGASLGLAVLIAATFKVRGVTGDFVPVLEWRWSPNVGQAVPVEQAESGAPDIALPVASETDYPQFGGPDRTSRLPHVRLARDWKTDPPELLWRKPIGTGWSGFSVVGEFAVTTEQRGESELVSCYHLYTGDLLWAHSDESHYKSVIAGDGPRSVPTIIDGRVYAIGATGILNCLDLVDGSLNWSKEILTENEAQVPDWGYSCAPLVTDGKVIVRTGGDEGRSLAAYGIETGELVWSGGDDAGKFSYCSPVLATIDGVAQVLSFNDPGVMSHQLTTGELLWDYEWKKNHPHVAMPVVTDDGRVLISSGYGVGSQLIQVSRSDTGSWSAIQIWESKRLKSKFANVIVHNGFVYGLDDGIMVCLDLENGVRQWKRGRYGHGQLILAGDVLFVMAEDGDIVLVQPSAEKHEELGRFPVLTGKSWNPPALAGDYLLVRNDKEAACYRMPQPRESE